jgi:hypothetical protein
VIGPHLTPEREAEIREWRTAYLEGDADIARRIVRPAIDDLLAALDAERAAHNLTRAALADSTALLIGLTPYLPGFESMPRHWRDDLDTQVQENQRVLGLAVAEADKPHHGNER